MSGRDFLLVIDTATRHPTLALIGAEGDVVGQRQWLSQHRHGEELLQNVDELLSERSAGPADIGGLIVGIGPGSFTGLRIGLATAKTIAYSLAVPVVGVSTTQALALAALDGEAGEHKFAVTLPAGATDRYLHLVTANESSVRETGQPQLVVPGSSFEEACGEALVVAIDLDAADDISDEDAARGETALAGLARSLATLGTKALNEGRADDVARLVPAYVALPRGIASAAAEMTWSPDLR